MPSLRQFHNDIRSAVIGLGSFVNGDDVGVMDAAQGIHLSLKARQKFRNIEKFAVQDFEGHGTVSLRKLLGEKDLTHAPFAETADQTEAAGQPGGRLRFGLRPQDREASTITRTVRKIVRVSQLACGTGFHVRL